MVCYKIPPHRNEHYHGSLSLSNVEDIDVKCKVPYFTIWQWCFTPGENRSLRFEEACFEITVPILTKLNHFQRHSRKNPERIKHPTKRVNMIMLSLCHTDKECWKSIKRRNLITLCLLFAMGFSCFWNVVAGWTEGEGENLGTRVLGPLLLKKD